MEPRRYVRGTDEFGRAVTFLDALFAFALTLLVTTLDVPPADSFRSVPSFVAAVGVPGATVALSFVVIATFWRAHHGLTWFFAAVDARSITLNLVLSATVVLLPFATEVLAAGQSDAVPVALYATDVGVAGLALAALTWHGVRAGLLHPWVDHRALRRQAVIGLGRPAVFALSIALAFGVGTAAAQFSWLLLVPVGVLSSRSPARACLDG